MRWHSPPKGAIKLNFDGSLKHSSAAGGHIIRDWTGKLIKASAANYGDTTILVAEARALRDGVQAAVQAGYNNIFIEGDNLTVIKAVNGEGQTPWRISNIIRDVQGSLLQSTHTKCKHIFREANMAADWLANFGHSITGVFSADFCFSPHLYQILADNVVGRTLVRRGA